MSMSGKNIKTCMLAYELKSFIDDYSLIVILFMFHRFLRLSKILIALSIKKLGPVSYLKKREGLKSAYVFNIVLVRFS